METKTRERFSLTIARRWLRKNARWDRMKGKGAMPPEDDIIHDAYLLWRGYKHMNRHNGKYVPIGSCLRYCLSRYLKAEKRHGSVISEMERYDHKSSPAECWKRRGENSEYYSIRYGEQTRIVREGYVRYSTFPSVSPDTLEHPSMKDIEGIPLSDKQRQVLSLLLAGYSKTETAKHIGVNPSRVTAICLRVRELLLADRQALTIPPNTLIGYLFVVVDTPKPIHIVERKPRRFTDMERSAIRDKYPELCTITPNQTYRQ